MMLSNIINFIIKLRFFFLLVFLVLTVIFGYKASKIWTYDDPNKWPPPENYNVKLNNFIQGKFGGANVVTIQITVKENTIFNKETLGKIKRISDKILKTYGVVPYYLTSLSALKVRYMKGTEDLLDNSILMSDVPQNFIGIEKKSN